MNILILNSTSDLYGSSKILIYIVKTLVKTGHKPIIVVSEDGPLVPKLTEIGVQVEIIRLGILRRKYFNIKGLANRLLVSRDAWKKLSRLIEDEKIDHIYSNTTGVLIGAFLAKKRKLPHTWHVHEIITSPTVFTKVIGYLLKKFSDQVIVVSDAVSKHWKPFVGNKIKRIYNGIDCSTIENSDGNLKQELQIPQTSVLIGMIGRVNHWKGQDYFLTMIKPILETHPDVQVALAGDAFPGNEHLVDALRENIHKSRFAHRIHYLGFRDDIPNLMNSFDIFVSPSILPDPFPTVILEAMAASKPVVATAHGGAVEMIDNQVSGVLIPFNDAIAARDLLLPIIESAALREKMGKAGHQRIHNLFSKESFERSIASLF